MTLTIRTHEPRDLLSLIPYQLGFRPRDSAVLVSLRGGSRVGLVARVDLPDLTDTEHGPPLARSLAGHLLADGAGAAVLILYTDHDLQADPTVGARALAHVSDAVEAYLPAPQCWVVGPHGYYTLGCDDLTCCPRGGRPSSDLESSRVGAEMVLLGAGVVASRGDLAQMPTVSADARRSARRASRRWASRLEAIVDPGEANRWRRESLDLWRSLVTEGETSAPAFGRMQAALDDFLVRDAVLIDLLPGRARLAERVAAGWSGPEVGEALGVIMDPASGLAPPEESVESARRVLHEVAGHRPQRTAPALALLAMMSWWRGDGARAGVLVDRALAEDPDYRLARLIEQTLATGMPPGWLNRGTSRTA